MQGPPSLSRSLQKVKIGIEGSERAEGQDLSSEKNKTFSYVFHDLRLQAVRGGGLVKCYLKARTGCPVQTRHSH